MEEEDILDECLKIEEYDLEKELSDAIVETLKRIKKNDKYIQRPRWSWRVCIQRDVKEFIEKIISYSIVKKPQLEYAYKYLLLDNVWSEEEREIFKKEMSEYKQKENYQSIQVDSSQINIPYLAGITDAEGCLTLPESSCANFNITQNNCPNLLFAIQKYLGCGNLKGKKEFYICNFKDILTVGRKLIPFLIQKGIQMQIYLKKDRHEWRVKIYRLLQLLKRG